MNQTKDAAQIDWSRFDEKSFESLMAASKHGLSYADLKDSPVNFHLGQVTFKDTTFDFQFVPRGILCQSNHPTLGSWYLSDDSWISTEKFRQNVEEDILFSQLVREDGIPFSWKHFTEKDFQRMAESEVKEQDGDFGYVQMGDMRFCIKTDAVQGSYGYLEQAKTGLGFASPKDMKYSDFQQEVKATALDILLEKKELKSYFLTLNESTMNHAITPEERKEKTQPQKQKETLVSYLENALDSYVQMAKRGEIAPQTIAQALKEVTKKIESNRGR